MLQPGRQPTDENITQHRQCASEQATKRSSTATRSTSVTIDQPSAAGYGLTLPSEAEVIADLMKLVGADVATFASREASDPDEDAGPRGNVELLLRIGEQLAARSDVAGVFGRSLVVRVNTYIALSSARTSA
jgi:hypothetical protein